MTQPMGPDATDTGIIIECDLEQRPELVWQALTDPDLVTEWLGPNTLRPQMDTRFTVQLEPGEGGPVTCQILEAIPYERLSYSWVSPGAPPEEPLDTVVTFELTRTQGNGTRLQVTHDRRDIHMPAHPVAMTAVGRTLAQIRPNGRISGRKFHARPSLFIHRTLLIATSTRRAA